MARKVCRKCRIFVEKDKCPICGNSNFSDNWKGRISIIDHEKSEIAKKLEIKKDGEYTIKVR
jgi:DNA-directed RNA polymerase subunit E"